MAKVKSISQRQDDKSEHNDSANELKRLLRILAEIEYDFYAEQNLKRLKENSK